MRGRLYTKNSVAEALRELARHHGISGVKSAGSVANLIFNHSNHFPSFQDDFIQKVLSVAHEKTPTFQGNSAWETWVGGISKNIFLNWQKNPRFKTLSLGINPEERLRVKRLGANRLERSVPVANFLGSLSQAPLEEQAERRELRRKIDENLAILPIKQREALKLHLSSGLSDQEIGQLLNTHSDKVKALKSRGRGNLVKELLKTYSSRDLSAVSGVRESKFNSLKVRNKPKKRKGE